MKSEKVRQSFLNFFQEKGHKIIPSSSILIKNDPTLMFTNSGMNAFKDFFLGYKKPFYSRIVNTQKCLRVTGKHNDLNEVGHDTYHHTMFEMLGNWSFGDYYKKHAIEWAWELLTIVYKIPKENIYITIFKGDTQDKLSKDIETQSFWEKIINKDHILFFGKKENFWEMGGTGPCGPSSEIHIDLRDFIEKSQVPGRELINKNHPQVIEIWNIVFIELFRKSNGSLEKLPEKHIDTGMGFERLCRILQKKKSNYDTDIFTPIIQKIEKYTGKYYGKENKIDIAIRVVSDHIRAISFAIADGEIPSNNGASYVIRRILRRAISYSYRFLEQKEPFIYKLVSTLVKEVGDTFLEIKSQEIWIKKIIQAEEKSFLNTISQGMLRMNNIIQELKGQNKVIIDGNKIFELYDTYGFPKDLACLLAKENGLIINDIEFKKEMSQQKNRSQKANNIEKGDWIVLMKEYLYNTSEKHFLGYDQLHAIIKIVQYRKIKSLKNKYYEIVFDQTPFYPEGGGQIGDSGFIKSCKEKIIILNSKKENNLILHITKEFPKYPLESFQAEVDNIKREKITINHTATHLLYFSLKNILGNNIEQKGSYINAVKLRFDFSYPYKLSVEKIKEIEIYVQNMIFLKYPLEENRNILLHEALKKGAIGLFEEKYSDKVRIIRFGNSIELCCGTHVNNTKKIQYFKIISEFSISTGIRRIEAITSNSVIDYFKLIYNRYNLLLNQLNYPTDPIKRIKNLQEKNKTLKIQNQKFISEQIKILKKSWSSNIEKTRLASLILQKTNLDLNIIKIIVLELRKEIIDLFIFIGWVDKNQTGICIAISDKLINSHSMNALNIIQKLAPYINGKVGGKNFFAIAKGNNPQGLDTALYQSKLIFL